MKDIDLTLNIEFQESINGIVKEVPFSLYEVGLEPTFPIIPKDLPTLISKLSLFNAIILVS